MDQFVQHTAWSCSCTDKTQLVMDYYDGNTVTGLWNYAQHFAMSDNSYSDDVRAVHAGSDQRHLG